MAQRFIKLFEDFKKEKLETWQQVRDVIQMKRPFLIIVFRTSDSYRDAIDSEFKETNYIKQTAYMDREGQTIAYPSIFLTLEQERNQVDSIKKYYDQFDLKMIISGDASSEFSTVYFSDGTSSDFGNEIVSSTNQNEVDDSDYFKVGATYYKFIEFHD